VRGGGGARTDATVKLKSCRAAAATTTTTESPSTCTRARARARAGVPSASAAPRRRRTRCAAPSAPQPAGGLRGYVLLPTPRADQPKSARRLSMQYTPIRRARRASTRPVARTHCSARPGTRALNAAHALSAHPTRRTRSVRHARGRTSDQVGWMLLTLTCDRPACSWYCGACSRHPRKGRVSGGRHGAMARGRQFNDQLLGGGEGGSGAAARAGGGTSRRRKTTGSHFFLLS
jgi:hypothetical protein